MKINTKFICAAAGLAGAFLLGSSVAVLLMKHCKDSCICSFYPCDPAEGQTAEKDIIQETPSSEVNCDEN